jgi:hypothetical protein
MSLGVCPKCDYTVQDVDDLDPYYSGESTGGVVCPACGESSRISSWIAAAEEAAWDSDDAGDDF